MERITEITGKAFVDYSFDLSEIQAEADRLFGRDTELDEHLIHNIIRRLMIKSIQSSLNSVKFTVESFQYDTSIVFDRPTYKNPE